MFHFSVNHLSVCQKSLFPSPPLYLSVGDLSGVKIQEATLHRDLKDVDALFAEFSCLFVKFHTCQHLGSIEDLHLDIKAFQARTFPSDLMRSSGTLPVCPQEEQGTRFTSCLMLPGAKNISALVVALPNVCGTIRAKFEG